MHEADMKTIQRHMSLGTHKLEQWDTTVLVLEWPNSETLVTPNAGEDLEQWDSSFIAGTTA